MTTKDREAATFLLERILIGLSPSASPTQTAAGRAACTLLIDVLDGSHGASSHAPGPRRRKAPPGVASWDEVASGEAALAAAQS